jgi:hypothetical protein
MSILLARSDVTPEGRARSDGARSCDRAAILPTTWFFGFITGTVIVDAYLATQVP